MVGVKLTACKRCTHVLRIMVLSCTIGMPESVLGDQNGFSVGPERRIRAGHNVIHDQKALPARRVVTRRGSRVGSLCTAPEEMTSRLLTGLGGGARFCHEHRSRTAEV